MNTKDVEGLKKAFIIKGNEMCEYPLILSKVDNTPPDVKIETQLKSCNEKIFDLVQRCQEETDRESILADMKKIDKQIEGFSEDTKKIGDKSVLKDLLERLDECKKRTLACIEALKSNTKGKLDNATFATLNDLAYKGIRKVDQAKKLER